MAAPEIDDELLRDMYSWIDQIPLSRPKKDLKRDFSDGVMMAELLKHHHPQLVEMHSYSPANSTDLKVVNWKMLNRKVFKKLGFSLSENVILDVAACKPWVIENVLMMVRRKLDNYRQKLRRLRETDPNYADRPEVDQVLKLDSPGLESPKPSRASKISFMGSPRQEAVREPTQRISPYKGRGNVIQTTIRTPAADPMNRSQSLQDLQQQIKSQRSVLQQKAQTDLVPRALLQEKDQELLTKDETIQILNSKIRRMEQLIELKDIRIDDLQGRVEQLETQSSIPPANYQQNRPRR